MGADIKQIRNRIRSVDSTLHVTRAMQLVASSKIRRAAEASASTTEYASALRRVLSDILSTDTAKSPFLSPPKTGIRCTVLIAGDRGMAGGYNSSVFRLFEEDPEALSGFVLPIGRRALDYCERRGYRILSADYPSSERITESQVSSLASLLTTSYSEHKFDSLYVIGTRLVNVLTQEAECHRLLPLSPAEIPRRQVLYEPSGEAVLSAAIPSYLTALLLSTLRESFLSELYARRNAMDSASKNAGEMIEGLRLSYNRARQSSITQEITEIVAGAGSQ